MKILYTLLLIPGLLLAQDQQIPQNYHQELARFKAQALEQSQEMHKAEIPTEYGSYDVQYYALDLTFNNETEIVSGTVEMRAKSLSAQAGISLDLYNNMTVDSIYGRPDSYTHINNTVTCQFDSALENGEIFSIFITYHGSPQVAGFQGLTFDNHSQGPIISSLSEPYFARTWWPCKDVQADKADSVDIHLTVDNTLTPVSNGTLVGITPSVNGSPHTYHWKVNYPITTYLVSVAISNYEHFTETYYTAGGDSMLLDYYVYPQEFSNSYVMNNIDETTQMLEVFAQLFGEYPFLQEKYGMASFSWGGAMEHQTISSMGSYNRMIIAHELAHQWWGNMVTTKDWNNIWLNEGFASYSEALYLEEVSGRSTYHSYMANMAYRGSGTVYVQDTTNVWRIFSGALSYDKGAYVLHMLRHVVGDTDFFNGLLAYRDQHYMGVATTEDFQAVMEEESGIDLEAFFYQWIYSEGHPNYDYCLWAEDAGDSTEVNVCVHQTQQAPYLEVYEMPIDIQLTDSLGNDTTLVVQNNQREQLFTFLFDWQPSEVALDPDNWILKTANQVPVNITRDGCEFLTDFQLSPNYPNPFNSRTTLTFTLPAAEFVRAEIYDITGRKVATLFERNMQPDRYTVQWDARNDQGNVVSTGVYIFSLRYGNRVETQKMIYLK